VRLPPHNNNNNNKQMVDYEAARLGTQRNFDYKSQILDSSLSRSLQNVSHTQHKLAVLYQQLAESAVI